MLLHASRRRHCIQGEPCPRSISLLQRSGSGSSGVVVVCAVMCMQSSTGASTRWPIAIQGRSSRVNVGSGSPSLSNSSPPAPHHRVGSVNSPQPQLATYPGRASHFDTCPGSMASDRLVEAFARLSTADSRRTALQALIQELTPHEWRFVHALTSTRTFQFDIVGQLPVELVSHIFSHLDTSTPWRLQHVG